MKFLRTIKVFFLTLTPLLCVHSTANTSHLPADNQPSLSSLFTLSSTTTWKEFPLKRANKKVTPEKWVWMGNITLKSKQALKLKELKLQWRGKKITQLSASLYSKQKNGDILIPIEENLICDGFWNYQKQQLIFPMNEKIIATKNYHLVLSFSRTIEPLLKKGRFTIDKSNLVALSHPAP